MYTIAIVSQKGGAGKTTLAVHIAAEMQRLGARTLLMDLDPQASAASWGDSRGDAAPDVATEHPARLEQALNAARAQNYACVVIDTAPHADQAALRAAKAADLVVIPCRPAPFDVSAIRTTLELCELAQRPCVVIINAAPVRSRVVDDACRDLAGWGATVCPVVVHHRVAFQHCLRDGKVAAEIDAQSPAALEITAVCKQVGLCASVMAHT